MVLVTYIEPPGSFEQTEAWQLICCREPPHDHHPTSFRVFMTCRGWSVMSKVTTNWGTGGLNYQPCSICKATVTLLTQKMFLSLISSTFLFLALQRGNNYTLLLCSHTISLSVTLVAEIDIIMLSIAHDALLSFSAPGLIIMSSPLH